MRRGYGPLFTEALGPTPIAEQMVPRARRTPLFDPDQASHKTAIQDQLRARLKSKWPRQAPKFNFIILSMEVHLDGTRHRWAAEFDVRVKPEGKQVKTLRVRVEDVETFPSDVEFARILLLTS